MIPHGDVSLYSPDGHNTPDKLTPGIVNVSVFSSTK